MTFEQFQATRKQCDNLGEALRDEMLMSEKGLLYCGCLFIEDTNAWPTDAPGYSKGRWYTLIGRSEYQSDDLQSIERKLYEFAVSEGYTAETKP
jgi:hypothetical protein